MVGELIGAKAKAAGVTQVAFDRNGYLYHGCVKALADGARFEGLRRAARETVVRDYSLAACLPRQRALLSGLA